GFNRSRWSRRRCASPIEGGKKTRRPERSRPRSEPAKSNGLLPARSAEPLGRCAAGRSSFDFVRNAPRFGLRSGRRVLRGVALLAAAVLWAEKQQRLGVQRLYRQRHQRARVEQLRVGAADFSLAL